MIDKETQDVLNQLGGTLYGQALTKLLDQWKEENNSVKSINSLEELKGRQIAEKLVDDLFKFMEKENKETKSKNQYV